MARSGTGLGGLVGALLRSLTRAGGRPARGGAPAPRPGGRGGVRTGGGPTPAAGPGATHGGSYPGDFHGALAPVYAPHLDGRPDPGEIVWTWVPFEEDHTRGKDRPVLLVGREGHGLLGLMLTSRDHDTRPAPADERWLDLGTGDWDARRRPSEVRLDRVVRVDPSAVRREGAVLDRARFDAVARALRTGR